MGLCVIICFIIVWLAGFFSAGSIIPSVQFKCLFIYTIPSLVSFFFACKDI